MKPHVDMNNSELLAESLRLAELKTQSYLSEARKQDISRQLGYITFEIMCREGDVSAFNRLLGAVDGTDTVRP